MQLTAREQRFARKLTRITIVTGIFWMLGLILFASTYAFGRPAYDGVWLVSSAALLLALALTVRIASYIEAERAYLELEARVASEQVSQ